MPLLRDDVRWTALDDDGVYRELTAIPQPSDLPRQHLGGPIHFMNGDVYFIPDMIWDKKILEGLAAFKIYGVTTGVLYYDLFPLTRSDHRQDFKNRFLAWFLDTVRYADFFACDSQDTKEVLKKEFQKLTPPFSPSEETVFHFRLGADLPRPDASYSPNGALLKKAFDGGSTYLMVSSIEPRKNHSFLLDTFDTLWERHPDLKLCFIGRRWTEEDFPGENLLIQRMERHKERNKRFFWLEGLTDADVHWAYRNAKCVLSASLAEGFGLPVAEALHYGVPVLASDIPIFHEIAGDRVGYFDPQTPASLVAWIERIEKTGIVIKPNPDYHCTTWRESAEELLDNILRAARRARKNIIPKLRRHYAQAGQSASSVEHLNTVGARKDVVPTWPPLTLSVRRLLRLRGRELVRQAFRRFLHRLPEGREEEEYANKLKEGLSSLGLIAALRFSEEGERVAEPINVKYPALFRAFARLLENPGLWGRCARYFSALLSLSKNQARLSRVEVELQELREYVATLSFQYLPPAALFPVGPWTRRPASSRDAQAFEDYLKTLAAERGSDFSGHYEIYLPHIVTDRPFLVVGVDGVAELLRERGVNAQRASIDKAADRLVAEGHWGGVLFSHVMGEVSRGQQVELLSLARGKLDEDGVLILEEMNPEHPQAPFFPGPRAPSPRYLAFLARWCGFESVDFLGLYPAPYARSRGEDLLSQYRVCSVLASILDSHIDEQSIMR
jgi:glycosyltransferase involved in cell wall biosynthesis